MNTLECPSQRPGLTLTENLYGHLTKKMASKPTFFFIFIFYYLLVIHHKSQTIFGKSDHAVIMVTFFYIIKT